VPKFIRKISSRAWLTDDTLTLDVRIERGVAKFRDAENKPSVYIAGTESDVSLALAALEWNRKRDIEKIRKADYVVITDDQISRAGLHLTRTPAPIQWPRLRGRHCELTRHGEPCSDADLRRLVQLLIAEEAEHGWIGAEDLKEIARIESTRNPLRKVFRRLRMWLRSRRCTPVT
jgi:hypothetical protein